MSKSTKSNKSSRNRKKNTGNTEKIVWSLFGVVGIVLLIIIWVIGSSSKPAAGNGLSIEGESKIPAVVEESSIKNTISVNELLGTYDEASPNLLIFFDPICPGCGFVERESGETVQELVTNSEVNLYLAPLSFLDATSSDAYSTRVANSILEVADNDPENLLPFIKIVYDNQPEEGAAYIPVTNDDLVAFASEAGVPSTVSEAFKNNSYIEWIEESTNAWSSDTKVFPEGLGTPAYMVDLVVEDGVLEGGTLIQFTSDNVTEIILEALGL